MSTKNALLDVYDVTDLEVFALALVSLGYSIIVPKQNKFVCFVLGLYGINYTTCSGRIRAPIKIATIDLRLIPELLVDDASHEKIVQNIRSTIPMRRLLGKSVTPKMLFIPNHLRYSDTIRLLRENGGDPTNDMLAKGKEDAKVILESYMTSVHRYFWLRYPERRPPETVVDADDYERFKQESLRA